MTKENIYEMITNRIIEKLEQGVVPWRRPFSSAQAVNWKTQKAYRGVNAMLLDTGEYATFKQIQEAGGKVKKGAKSHPVIFWKLLDGKDEEGNETKIPLMRFYRVFEINTQVEGLESKRKSTDTYEHDPIEKCEEIIKGYINSPDFTWKSGEAYYSPSRDIINMPPMKDFQKIEEYYSVTFHEMIHSTGHKSRLNRDGVVGHHPFGSEDYSKEELVAEIGASMLCGVANIDNITIDNNAAYIQSWLRQLKNDKTLVVKASQQAQKAVDHVLNIKF